MAPQTAMRCATLALNDLGNMEIGDGARVNFSFIEGTGIWLTIGLRGPSGAEYTCALQSLAMCSTLILEMPA